jgi:hypothetical protein
MLGVFISILLNDRINRSLPYYRTLMFVAIYFFGMSIEQLWYWVWRHYAHGSRTWLTDFPLIVLLALNCIVVIGCIGMLRYFTLDRYGRWLWILLTAICLLLAMMTPMLPKI